MNACDLLAPQGTGFGTPAALGEGGRYIMFGSRLDDVIERQTWHGVTDVTIAAAVLGFIAGTLFLLF